MSLPPGPRSGAPINDDALDVDMGSDGAPTPASSVDVALTPLEPAAPSLNNLGSSMAAVASMWPGASVAAAAPPARPVMAALPPLSTAPPPPQAPPSPEDAARWQEAIASYDREAKALGADKRAAPLWFEIGRIFEERLLQPRQAASAYQAAFKTDPTFVPVIHAARRLFYDINNWPMVVTLLDSELAVEKRPRTRAALLLERGRILESKLNKGEDAFAAYRTAAEADRAFTPALDALGRMLRARGAHAELAGALEKAVEALPQGATRAERCLELARLREGVLAQPDQAVAAYKQALESDPTSHLALQALERLYARLSRHEELITVLTQLWEAAPNPEETASVPLAVARVARYALADDARAIGVLEKARHRTPRDASILRALAEVYAAAGRHQEHVEVLLALASTAKDEKQRAALHFEAGTILEERLKDESAAIRQYREVATINPRFLPALQALGRLFQRNGRFEELAQMYEAEVQSLEDPAQKVPRLFKLAELRLTALGDDDGAIRCYRDILVHQPGYLPALKQLGALLGEAGRFEELIQLYEDELKDTRDRDQTIYLLDKIAGIWEERLGRLDKAIDSYERILKVAPNYLPAIRELAGLFARAERWADLIRVNSVEAELTQDQKQVLALLHKNGEILEDKVGDKDAAVEAYQKVLALSPNYLPTLKSLGRIYSLAGNWRDLISMYRQEAEIARALDTRVELHFKIGQLLEERVQDVPAAIASYREVLAQKPDHHPAVRALMRLCLQTGNYTGMVEMAQREATLFTDPLEQAHSLYRAGEILHARLGRTQEAAQLFQRALELHPTFDAALSAQVELASSSGDVKAEHDALRRALDNLPKGRRWMGVARSLAELLSERLGQPEAAAPLWDQILAQAPNDLPALRGALSLALRRRDWPRAADVASRLAPLEPEADAAAALYLQMAAWRQHHMEPAVDGVPAYLRALEYAPQDPVAIRAAERAYRRTQAWAALYELYDRERTQLPDPVMQLDLCMRMADLATYYLSNDDLAVGALEKALQADRSYMPALRRLGPMYDKLGRHSEKLQLLAMEAEATKDPARAFSTLLEVAQLQEEKFKNVDAAVDCYFRVLDRDPRHALAMQKLDALLQANQKWDRLVDLLGHKAAFTSDGAEKVDLFLRAAQLMVDRLNRPNDAVPVLMSLLRTQPQHVVAITLLGDIHDKAGRAAEAAQAYGVLLPLLTDPARASQLNQRLGQLYRGLGDVGRAAHHLGAALAARSQDMALATELADLYLSQNAWQQAADMLVAMSERDPTPEGRFTHLGKLARVMEEGFADLPRTMDACRRMLELRPDNQPTVDKLAALAEKLGDFGALALAYQAMLSTTPRTDRPRLAQLHLKLANIYLQRLNAPDKGQQELRAAVDADPDNVEARAMLASLLSRNPGTFSLAVDEHKRVLAQRPAHAASYKELARMFDQSRQRDRQFIACEILHFLRQGGEAEEFFYGDNKNKVRQESDAALSGPEHEMLLVHPRERGPIRDIIKAVARELYKVFPTDLTPYGLGRADKLGPKSPDGVRRLADNVMRALGGGEFDLYVSKVKTMDLAMASVDPPGVVVGADVSKRHQTREQRFLLAQRLEGLYSGHQVTADMEPLELKEFVLATCLAVDEQFPGNPSPEVVDLAKKIRSAMSRSTRKLLLEPVGEAATLMPRWDPLVHLKASRFTRLRAAVAVSNDVEVTLRLLARELGVTLTVADPADLEKKMAREEFREVMAFILSDEYATLRQKLRFAVDT